jgi:Zn ribbon nucleic-acid-binding protein
MTIKIWNSYSCNNSSSYRLVARFANHATAQAAATDLDVFFKAYAIEIDALVEANDFTWPDEWPPGALAFAKKHGFAWGREVLSWGDTGLTEDEPEIAVEDEVLLIHHSYCGGGFGKGVPAYLAARGAKVEREQSENPWLTLLFSYAGGSKKLDGELKKLFAQVDEESREVEPLVTPWKGRECYGSAAFYRDAKTVGMVIPFEPPDLPSIRAWLTKRGITKPSIRLCEPADEEKLAAIAGAKCEACAGALELWHPALRDVDTEQMACVSCGGMYEIATFVVAAKKREQARRRAEAKATKLAQERAVAEEAAKKANAKNAKKAKPQPKPKPKKPKK